MKRLDCRGSERQRGGQILLRHDRHSVAVAVAVAVVVVGDAAALAGSSGWQ